LRRVADCILFFLEVTGSKAYPCIIWERAEGFVWNAIEVNLLEILFNQKGALWEGSNRKADIRVPLNFGLELI
jgi:hypothetical protein